MHQQLLIGVTLQFRRLLQPLRPRLFNYRRARPGRSFVQRPNGIEVDVLVQRVLDGGGDVVAVVVPAVAVRVVVTMVMAIVLIVAVMRHCERVVLIGDLVMELSVVANKVGVGWRGYEQSQPCGYQHREAVINHKPRQEPGTSDNDEKVGTGE